MIKPKEYRNCANKKCGKEFKKHKTTDKFCSRLCYLVDLGQKEIENKRTEIKKGLLTLTDYENAAKVVFQKWVRLRDALLPCISCGRYDCPDWSGGHWWAAGQYSGLMFHPCNCNKQCNSHCNKFLSGNPSNYRIGLVKKIGEEKVKWLEENKDRLKNKKWTREELIEITKVYKLKIKNNDYSNEPFIAA